MAACEPVGVGSNPQLEFYEIQEFLCKRGIAVAEQAHPLRGSYASTPSVSCPYKTYRELRHQYHATYVILFMQLPFFFFFRRADDETTR